MIISSSDNICHRRVEIFKTNVQGVKQSEQIIKMISNRFPNYKINFDLVDCDRILRVENKMGEVEICEVIKIVQKLSFAIEIFAD